MKKAQAEIDSVLGQDGPNLESIKKLEYVPKTFTELVPFTCICTAFIIEAMKLINI